ncbi:MAG: amidohydrolase family protein [Christensenellaceae bacterium]|jgi:predicted TIM-barrel fold metal-dependent hydrolase|nr:amidohydrolase family protein [Christensenellaceae bacterium]
MRNDERAAEFIIDAHCHIFPAKIAEKATQNIGRFYETRMDAPAGEVDALLQSGKAIGVGRYVVCSVATKASQVQSINNFIAESCAAHPEFLGLLTLTPDFEAIGQEIDRALALGLRGVKLHPDFQGFAIDDEAVFSMYEAIAARGLPLLFHAGDRRYAFSSPERLAKVARRFPGLTCVAAHFGGYSEWERVRVYDGLENVFFDTCSALGVMPDLGLAERLIEHFGAERFMFGTDFPMWGHEAEFARFGALPLSAAQREQILHKTAEKVYFGA